MSATITQYNNVIVLTVKDDLAGEYLDAFNEGATQCLNDGHYYLVIDCSAVSALDSAGLEMLSDLQDKCEDAFGSVKLCSLDETLITILEITRLGRRFECFDDLDAAVRSFA